MRREVGEASSAGFTIIEVVLFLAISGSLVVALLATVGTSISRQRFTDSLTGTTSFMQLQYDETLNVVNNRTVSGCSKASGVTITTGGGSARGASGCVILGKSLEFSPTSATIMTHTIIGTEPTVAGPQTGADLLKTYAPGVDGSSSSPYDIPWGTTVNSVRVDGTSNHVNRILLLRSPDSGTILTFGDNGGNSLVGALSSGPQTYNVCIQSADLVGTTALVSLSPIAGAEGVIGKSDGFDKAASC